MLIELELHFDNNFKKLSCNLSEATLVCCPLLDAISITFLQLPDIEAVRLNLVIFHQSDYFVRILCFVRKAARCKQH
jgi:hypothetical protein